MVEFGTGYMMPMDRAYFGESEVKPKDVNGTNDIGVAPIRDIGLSVPFGIAARNVAGVAGKMRTGTRLIELQFSGMQSRQNQQSPGLYGKIARQALEEISRANKVDYTTHATWQVFGLSGMDQQGNFSKENKKAGVDEIKRAVDFASDVARGGSVVVHTGEFRRPISEEAWARDPQTGRHIFKSYEEEPERAILKVVDDRTGQVNQVHKNRRVPRAVWLTAKPGEEYIDIDGTRKKCGEGEKIYIDYDGTRVQRLEDRRPVWDNDKQRFVTEYWKWEDFSREAKDRTLEARRAWREWKKNPNDPNNPINSIYSRFRDASSENEIEFDAEEAYFLATLETQAANAKGLAPYYSQDYQGYLNMMDKLKKALKVYEKIEAATSPEDEWKLKQQYKHYLMPEFLPPESEKPTEMIKKRINDVQRHIEHGRELARSQETQAKEIYETMAHIVSQKKYALKESYDAYAQAGMHAWERSKKLKQEGKLKQPIFVAMENIFPESYGGHPDEFITLVKGARGEMQRKLIQRGMSEQEAQRVANDHIKGHLDTGHINMWRKYWQGDPKRSLEENDKAFNKWLIEKVDQMSKDGMVGSVHLADNYGYQDEHLSPGQGNTPVVEMVKVLKKNGYKGQFVVEPGADATADLSDFHGVMKTWRLFGSSIYGAGFGGRSPATQRWSQVQYGYFGQAEPPYFVFGGYSPSEDWTLWSGVKME